MAPRDSQAVRIDTSDPRQWQPLEDGDVCWLCTNDAEHVWLQRVPPGGIFRVDGGFELLILDGEANLHSDCYPPGTWMRFPAGDQARILAGTQGTTLYVKRGQLIPASTGAIHA